MSLGTMIYIITTVDQIAIFLGVLLIANIIAVLAWTLTAGIVTNDKFYEYEKRIERGYTCNKPSLKWIKWSILHVIVIIALGIMQALLPTSKSLALIWGIPAIVESEKIQILAGKTYDVLNIKLEQYVEESKRSIPDKK